MSPEEAVMLCRYVKACCPQQAIDQHTPIAWADHLIDVPYEDAKAAAREITARQPFVTIAEILTIVRRVRSKRIADSEAQLLPPDDAREGAAHRAWLRQAKRRLGDGEPVEAINPPALGASRPMPDLKALMPAPDTTEETA